MLFLTNSSYSLGLDNVEDSSTLAPFVSLHTFLGIIMCSCQPLLLINPQCATTTLALALDTKSHWLGFSTAPSIVHTYYSCMQKK